MKETLMGKRIYLAFPIGKVSMENVHQYMSNENTAKFVSAAPFPYTMNHATMFLKFVERTEKAESTYQFGIFDKTTDSFIGMISLENIDYESKKCEIGYWMAEEYTGKGLAKESCKLLIDFAFQKLGMNKIAAFAIKENIASIALLTCLGFVIEGLLREDVKNKGKLADRYAFALFNSNQASC